MTKLFLVSTLCASLSACAVVRTAGNVAVGTGQVVLGAADVVL